MKYNTDNYLFIINIFFINVQNKKRKLLTILKNRKKVFLLQC